MEGKKLPLIQGTVPKRGEEFYQKINRIYERERKETIGRSSSMRCGRSSRVK